MRSRPMHQLLVQQERHERRQCQRQRTGWRYRDDSSHVDAYETHFHFFILGSDEASHLSQLNLLACLASLSESVTYRLRRLAS
jgi:hypothetical protein